jgi:meiotic recombination protein DMC1
VEKILESSRKLKPTGFVNGVEALRLAKLRVRISTGCKELDAILGGGVECGSVTEVFGEFRCGKTQLAATLAVNAQLDAASGGASGKVIILDTENAFRVERVAEIAEKRYGLDPAAVLDNITLARCLTHEHQQEMALAAAALITGAGESYKLLIVDSIIG